MDTRIVLFNGQDTSWRPYANSCAECYCQIWREAPWYEDFWQVVDVVADLESEMSMTGSALALALNDKKVIGFTWGYLIDQEKLREISGSSELVSYLQDCTPIFYIDELATDSCFRGNGLAHEMSIQLLQHASMQCQRALLRTDIEAQAAQQLYKKLGFNRTDFSDRHFPRRLYWTKAL